MVRTMSSVNLALVTWSEFINQTWVSVFLGIKNTEARAYRTDPVQLVAETVYCLKLAPDAEAEVCRHSFSFIVLPFVTLTK
ncbi:hypothetical protein QVD17_34108 [Tagetes erecta]|uniref:Uncharacterized protein n=1 Tax=Tagetes erecta TaxID=13708 RepID=A0AAD8K084_TARER|nr:hypothetical protein QVD17_34108 [Tagetes erecta]